MEEILKITNAPKWVCALEEVVKFKLKTWIKEAVEEVFDERMCNANLEDKRLNVEELCERWDIAKSTLYNWEKEGIISPLPIGGRRKIYSMRDVLNAETNGLVKTAC